MFIALNSGSELKFHDTEMLYLEELLKFIDIKLSDITDQIKATAFGDSEYLCDRGEYFIGVGFCAMQRYLFNVLENVKIDPGLARDLGPLITSNVSVARLIHSAANYWKHSPEWHNWLEELDKRSQKTVDELLHGRELAYYPLSDLLADLCKDDTLLLTGCLPYLVDWRLAVYEYKTKNV